MRRARAALWGMISCCLVLLLLATACGDGGRTATAPAATERPEAVVRSFLEALGSGDVEQARAYTTPLFRERSDGSPVTWFNNVEELTDIWVGVAHAPHGSGRLGTMEAYPYVMVVPTTYVITQRTVGGQRDGLTHTDFVLARSRPSDPWLIDDSGF